MLSGYHGLTLCAKILLHGQKLPVELVFVPAIFKALPAITW